MPDPTPTPAAAPAVASTIGLKNLVIAPVESDTESSTTYGDLQRVAGAIEASITPSNTDPDVQYYDDVEGDVLYPDPELSFKTKLADIPLTIQEMIFGNEIDNNGVLIRTATDKPGYFAVVFKSEKANGKFRYVWLYKVRAKPVTENYATKEGKTINRQTGEVIRRLLTRARTASRPVTVNPSCPRSIRRPSLLLVVDPETPLPVLC